MLEDLIFSRFKGIYSTIKGKIIILKVHSTAEAAFLWKGRREVNAILSKWAKVASPDVSAWSIEKPERLRYYSPPIPLMRF